MVHRSRRTSVLSVARVPGCEGTGAAKRSYPKSKAAQAQEGQKELLHFKVRRVGHEEIPLVQGKAQ